MRNTGLDKTQAGIKIAGRNIKNLRYADDTTLLAESEEELKSLLMKVKEESEKAGLNSAFKKQRSKKKQNKDHCIQSHHFTTIDGETVERVTDFIFVGFKITADGDCSREIKRGLLLGRKAMTNLHSVLKSRDIALLTEVHIVKAKVFSSSHVWM